PSFFAGRGTFHTGLPSFVPRHRACSFSPFSSSSAAVTNSLSPTTAGLEKPTPPRFAFHARGGPPWGHSLSSPFSGEWPSRLGPRHCGQSAAGTAAASSSVAAAARRTGMASSGRSDGGGGRGGRRKYTRVGRADKRPGFQGDTAGRDGVYRVPASGDLTVAGFPPPAT